MELFDNEEGRDLMMVKAIAEIRGYGRLMQWLSEEWHKKDPEGALTVGPCYGTLVKADNPNGDPLDPETGKPVPHTGGTTHFSCYACELENSPYGARY
jgi:hypothetical protein